VFAAVMSGDVSATPSVTLSSLLAKFSDEEMLDNSDSWYCKGCKTHTKVSYLMSGLPTRLLGFSLR
jgi:hypothetical protein